MARDKTLALTNTKLLEDVIERSGLKKGHIAEKLGISRAGLNNCINNKAEFKVSQMYQLCELLGIDQEQSRAIFYAVGGA